MVETKVNSLKDLAEIQVEAGCFSAKSHIGPDYESIEIKPETYDRAEYPASSADISR